MSAIPKMQIVSVKQIFSRQTMVGIDINATPEIIWSLLTNAADYPRWNSTVTSIEGNIAAGEKIKLLSVLGGKRVFKLKIKQFEPNKRLVWGDSYGDRTYKLTENGRTTKFTMDETIGGILFPLYSGHIPPFEESFKQFAADLKKEAEAIQSTKK